MGSRECGGGEGVGEEGGVEEIFGHSTQVSGLQRVWRGGGGRGGGGCGGDIWALHTGEWAPESVEGGGRGGWGCAVLVSHPD